MILTNLLFVIACTFLLGLQKLLYGNLRPIEIEQLYEKAWFAVTETCLAMTVFRGEIGLTFLAMFFALLTGKVWGWIGEGRVEVLEQQPPRDPRLFHTRLALSLALSVAFDLTMLEYVVKQVMRMARPDMMVMFGFEFAVLSITSISTAMRYAIDLVEIGIVREQKKHRIEEIKRERVQAAVAEFQEAQSGQTADVPPAATATDATTSTTSTPTPTRTQRTLEQVSQEALNQPVDENEVEVEGWEEKGRYMFYLNLATDFFKLVIYLAFFFILLVFYGLPIHILRDVFLTMRSFLKRISDFMKYRTATRDMNARYPDATAEDIGREDVCIICREEMRPYEAPVVEQGQPAPRPNPVAERMRPKKLPCGHVLHFSCLRSWLERQQICPTCRANVVRPPGTQTTEGPGGQGGAARGDGRLNRPGAARPGPRVFQFGPLRIGVGAARGNNMFEELQQQLGDRAAPPPAPANGDANAPQQFGVGVRWSGMRRRRNADQNLTIQQQIDALDDRIAQEMAQLDRSVTEVGVLRTMHNEMQRLRRLRPSEHQQPSETVSQAATATSDPSATTIPSTSDLPAATVPAMNDLHAARVPATNPAVPLMWTRLATNSQNIIPAGSDRLPSGLTLPEGWTMMPLQAAPTSPPAEPALSNASGPHFPGPPAVVPMQGIPHARYIHPSVHFPQPPVWQHRPAQVPPGAEHPAATQPNGQPPVPQMMPFPPAPFIRPIDIPQPPFAPWGPHIPPQWTHRNEQLQQGARPQSELDGASNAAATNPQGSINGPPPSAPVHSSMTEPVNGHGASPFPAPVENDPVQPTQPPWWGSEEDSSGGQVSGAPPQVNGSGSHGDINAGEESSSGTSEPKNRQATVEDLVEDPD